MAVSRPEGGGILVCRAVSRLVRRWIDDGLTRANGQNPLPRPALGLGQTPPRILMRKFGAEEFVTWGKGKAEKVIAGSGKGAALHRSHGLKISDGRNMMTRKDLGCSDAFPSLPSQNPHLSCLLFSS